MSWRIEVTLSRVQESRSEERQQREDVLSTYHTETQEDLFRGRGGRCKRKNQYPDTYSISSGVCAVAVCKYVCLLMCDENRETTQFVVFTKTTGMLSKDKSFMKSRM